MIRKVLIAVVLALPGAIAAAETPAQQPATPAGEPTIVLYFFWTQHCPHCREALPFVAGLTREYAWLEVRSLDVGSSREAVRRYRELAARFGAEARSVPAFLYCDVLLTGFDRPEGIGAEIRRGLEECRARMLREGLASIEPGPRDPVDAPAPPASIRVPVLGTLAPGEWSLPLLTVVIAGLDAFNPCAFFVLLFLLSIVVHTRSRRRILLIGGIFVTISGVIYFVFMAAWLNVFLIFGEIGLITRIAGTVAVVLALINIKDYFWFQVGPTLSIPDAARPGLFRRMRALTTTTRLPVLLGATIALAVTVNLYEILCTLGFPMVYTRILTMSEVGALGYYGYLLLYNVIYVLPMLLIVGLFAWTLGSRKLQEREGRILKLLAGMMMLGLGLVLLLAPDRMSNPLVAVGLLLGAGVVTWGVVRGGRNTRQ